MVAFAQVILKLAALSLSENTVTNGMKILITGADAITPTHVSCAIPHSMAQCFIALNLLPGKNLPLINQLIHLWQRPTHTHRTIFRHRTLQIQICSTSTPLRAILIPGVAKWTVTPIKHRAWLLSCQRPFYRFASGLSQLAERQISCCKAKRASRPLIEISIFLCRRSTILWSLGGVNEHAGEWAKQNGGSNRLQWMHKDVHNFAIIGLFRSTQVLFLSPQQYLQYLRGCLLFAQLSIICAYCLFLEINVQSLLLSDPYFIWF